MNTVYSDHLLQEILYRIKELEKQIDIMEKNQRYVIRSFMKIEESLLSVSSKVNRGWNTQQQPIFRTTDREMNEV